MNNFSNITLAYKSALKYLFDNGLDIGDSKEILSYSFSVESPYDKTIFLVSRKIDLPFAVANSIWTLAGSDNLEFINFYMGDTQLSDEQTILHCGCGKRLFNAEGINQIDGIIKRLRNDSFSRRAVAVTYHPLDSQPEAERIPCPVSIQFLQRNGKLHLINYMRSQSVAMILPYDFFCFSFLQEAISVELGLDLGNYYHISGSFHYYLKEENLVKEVIKEEQYRPYDAPKMPSDISPIYAANVIMKWENELRRKLCDNSDINKVIYIPELPKYWRDISLILLIRILENFNMKWRDYVLELPEYYVQHLR